MFYYETKNKIKVIDDVLRFHRNTQEYNIGCSKNHYKITTHYIGIRTRDSVSLCRRIIIIIPSFDVKNDLFNNTFLLRVYYNNKFNTQITT